VIAELDQAAGAVNRMGNGDSGAQKSGVQLTPDTTRQLDLSRASLIAE